MILFDMDVILINYTLICNSILHLTRPCMGFNIILNLREYKLSLYQALICTLKKCRSRHGLSNLVEFFYYTINIQKVMP